MLNLVHQNLLTNWKKIILWVAILTVVTIFSWIIWVTIKVDRTGFDEKNLFDWMDMLIVPLLLGVGIWWLNRTEKENERNIAAYRANKTDMQTYIDSMTDLLLEGELRNSAEDDEIRNVARILTLTVLSGLDGQQKAQIIRFLYESGLIFRSPIVRLSEADLRRTKLNLTNLSDSDLQQLDLEQAALVRTNLQNALLKDSRLYKANLTGAKLLGANLRDADLRRANLRESILMDTDFRNADLTNADLTDANLRETDFRRANLTRTNFSNAMLIDTNFEGATVSLSQLQKATLLQNVTLTNGQIFSNL